MGKHLLIWELSWQLENKMCSANFTVDINMKLDQNPLSIMWDETCQQRGIMSLFL